MSKKIASGAQAIVLDVKLGLGAFMRDLKDARLLAETMVAIGKLAERKTIALLSDMNQPLGFAVGNSLEVREAIDTLHGGGPDDFRHHCLVVAGQMLALGGLAKDAESGQRLAEDAIGEGRAWEKFRLLVKIQGGDTAYVDHPERLPRASLVQPVLAPQSGYLAAIHARLIGEVAVLLGAGRARKGDSIDHAVGIELHHKVGDFLSKGDVLFTVHANDQAALEEGVRQSLAAHTWTSDAVDPLPLFYDVIS
jgi:thymidine phosphorylase